VETASGAMLAPMTSPGVFAEQGADEVFGLVRDLIEALLVELPLGGCDQGEGLGVGVTLEWRLATQSEDQRVRDGGGIT